jgi:hypothetical protein
MCGFCGPARKTATGPFRNGSGEDQKIGALKEGDPRKEKVT